MGLLNFLSTLVGWLFGVAAKLPQSRTNGKSIWGTFLVQVLPFFLKNNPLPGGYPWGGRTSDGTNPYQEYPTTGVVRSYDFTVSRGSISPDGYQRDVLLVNGAYPGPLIESNWGDTIEVTVHNNITGPEEGTALHWHGFIQRGTPWEDGAPAISQCPIAPKKTFTYRFKATLYGTSWYHSHFSAQYSDGVLGPIVVHGPFKSGYDVDVGPVMLSDWYHKPYFQTLADIMAPNADPAVKSDNNLINGKMNFDCTLKDAGDKTPCTDNAGISKFVFQTGKTHRLRLINTGSEGLQRFSIDGHYMDVIAQDFVPVVKYTTKVVTLGIGQRCDVLVKANAGKSGDAFWMRSNITVCSLAKQPLAVAAIYYDKDTGKTPASTAWDVPDPKTCTNDDLATTQPLYKMKLPTPSLTKTFNVLNYRNDSGVALFKFDDTSFRGNFNMPTLLQAKLGNFSFAPEWNVKNFYTNSSVRMVVNNRSPLAHPMHLHGANMYVLHEGEGDWDGNSIVNPDNPLRRDVHMVRANGHLVVQFDADNPGVWPFHCHVAWHASEGFFAQLLVLPEKVKQFQIPQTVAETCREWAQWTSTNVPAQIDSGLKFLL